ncbi:putative phospholipase, mitochondrial [Cyphellophora attinorum]|uniref:Putative phospholipase, mitochondrial n=1 Tax=Cyphellophora attinorum TaxID=1664694 RepID=A0A0N1P4F8_9EURO|nr:putative phospholipase, mitochondrial [Phialophora attinorum]KPI45702.1 putative phospholipase, mitochondrial [Phialophora attinorum]
MADQGKASAGFLGSLSPWSRSSTPTPKSPQVKSQPKPEGLRQAPGLDHAVNIYRPSPSLKKYPRDCPPIVAKWYYAVDVAKRKTLATQDSATDNTKTAGVPKKYVQFSDQDSEKLEAAFLSLDKDDSADDDSSPTATAVAVNEDGLFDVHVERRELEPAYWLGPVYEVRRGSWFFQDSTTVLKPADENLANQLEEGYLKVMPWRNPASARSQSQPRPRPKSQLLEQQDAPRTDGTATPTEVQSTTQQQGNTYRLFGSWMHTMVTYQDANVAYLDRTDDFVSRMSSTLWSNLGSRGGLKVIRGYVDPSAKPADKASTADKRRSQQNVPEPEASKEDGDRPPEKPKKRNALERQISSLAGIAQGVESSKEAEQDAQAEQQQEMEDAREKDGEDPDRPIDHLVLVTHGIGQRLGLRLDSVNFVHDVNTMRKTMKAVYAASPDLQAVSGDPKNCRVQVLPVCWRHLLDFPKQSLKHNRKEFDLGDADDPFDEEYPSLQDITVDGVPAVRNLLTDLAMDILLYQSAYREHIASIVKQECNRVVALFKKRTGFNGRVSLCGHSLGSAVYFDLLCRQDDAVKTRPRRVSSRTSKGPTLEVPDLKFDFPVHEFFALGSPIALFQMLKGRTIAGRNSMPTRDLAFSPFDPDPVGKDPFENTSASSARSKELIPITTSSPLMLGDFYNIFHPTDPIAYRIEPLISPAMAGLTPQALPYTKKGLFGAPGIANITQKVGQSVMSSWYGLTSGVASSLINRSLGITGEDQALPQDKPKAQAITLPNGTVVAGGPKTPIADGKKQEDLAETADRSDEVLIDSNIETLYSGFQKRRRSQASNAASAAGDEDSTVKPAVDPELEQERIKKLKREEAKVKALNSNGRVDYAIQEGMFDVSLLASIASHLSYWADEDVHHFMLGQMLTHGKRGKTDRGETGSGPQISDKDVDALSGDIANAL